MKLLLRIFLSFTIIVAIGASSVVASRAMLTDQATLAANTFSTGTPDLLVCSGKTCTDYQDSHAGFTDTILPGETKTEFFRLKNNSSNVDFAISAQTANLSGGIDPDDVIVTFTPIDSSYEPIPDAVATSHTLSEWQSPAGLGIPTVTSGSLQRYKMDVTLSENVSAGAAQAIFDFVFTGTQTP